MKRYEIRLASLDPVESAEPERMRPVVIVSLDAINERLQTITVCPLSAQPHPNWRSRLTVRVGRRDAEIAVDQIRTISKSRLGKKVGALPEKDAGALRRLITEMYGE
jgi:mRNA interferase MazF